MEFLIVIGIIFIAIYLFHRSRKAKNLVAESEKDVSVTYSSSENFDNFDTGPITLTENDGFILNPKSTFPLTFYNINSKQATQLKVLLDEGCSEGSYRLLQKLQPFISTTNLRCKEIDNYVNEYKPLYLDEIEGLKKASQDWASATDKDKEDIILSFKKEAVQLLDVRPSCNLVTLFDGLPSDAIIDDALIQKYGYEALRFYEDIRKKDRIFTVPADGPGRKDFEKLVEIGLATRGKQIPLPDILSTLRLKDMTELVTDLDPPKFTRKAKAIDFLINIPNIQHRLGKKVSFRTLFKIIPLPQEFSNIDLNKIKSVWDYEKEIAFLIAHTYIAGSNAVMNMKWQTEMSSNVQGWELHGVDDDQTCPECKLLHGYVYPKHKYPKTPFHIGCRCGVRPKYK
jgi:hypothetical protein